jgi:Tetratricopeptide repeat
MGNERWGEAAGHRVSPSDATRSFPRQMLCLILSASVGVAACAGPGTHPVVPPVVSESDQVACAEFARQRTEQMRREAARASHSHWTGNDVGWIIMIIAASPVLVPMFVMAFPFGLWKAMRNPNPDTWQLVEERLVSLCTEPARLAATVGPRHPNTALALAALADQYREADRIESALDRYRQALTIQEEALGPEHPVVAVTLDGYARALSKAGRAAEAASMEDRARWIRAQAEASAVPDPASAPPSPGASDD